MTIVASLLNRATTSESRVNVLSDARILAQPSLDYSLPDDTEDAVLLAEAIERRGHRPLSSYRSLEDLIDLSRSVPPDPCTDLIDGFHLSHSYRSSA